MNHPRRSIQTSTLRLAGRQLALWASVVIGLIYADQREVKSCCVAAILACANSGVQQSGLDNSSEPDQVSNSSEQDHAQTIDDANDEQIRAFTLVHVFQILLIATVIIWGYSLVMSGKHGQGWLVVMAIGGVFAYLLRAFRSVFQEVASSNEVSDWDDE
jgi:hypothetical protein